MHSRSFRAHQQLEGSIRYEQAALDASAVLDGCADVLIGQLTAQTSSLKVAVWVFAMLCYDMMGVCNHVQLHEDKICTQGILLKATPGYRSCDSTAVHAIQRAQGEGASSLLQTVCVQRGASAATQ